MVEKVTITVTKVDSNTGEVTKVERDSPLSYENTLSAIDNLDDDKDDWFSSMLPKGIKTFSVMYDIFIKKLLNNYRDISRLALVVLLYLVVTSVYDKNATKCDQNTIAKELRVAPSQISVALNQLYQNDFVVKNRIFQGGYKFIVNPMYIRKSSRDKLKSLQVIYNKSYAIENATNKKGVDFSEKSTPNKKQNENNNNPDSCNNIEESISNNIKESIRRSIKFGKSGAQVRLFNYLLEHFRENSVLDKTVDEISFKAKVYRLSVLKFLKLLEENEFITRGRGRIELKVSYQEFSDISLGL